MKPNSFGHGNIFKSDTTISKKNNDKGLMTKNSICYLNNMNNTPSFNSEISDCSLHTNSIDISSDGDSFKLE